MQFLLLIDDNEKRWTKLGEAGQAADLQEWIGRCYGVQWEGEQPERTGPATPAVTV